MGLRLLILSWWTPKYIIRRELESISDLTTTALEELVSKYAIEEVDFANQDRLRSLSIPELREAMARNHAKLVETLEAKVGYEEAVKRGREALFLVGQEVGRKARRQLGVSDNPKDLDRAAKILYRVLGINFRLQWLDNSHAKAVIDRCALAEHYSKLTCEVLSATDEGVIRGLQPAVTMRFKEYMPSGCKNCIADIHFNGKEAH
jgi:hypothetical protein